MAETSPGQGKCKRLFPKERGAEGARCVQWRRSPSKCFSKGLQSEASRLQPGAQGTGASWARGTTRAGPPTRTWPRSRAWAKPKTCPAAHWAKPSGTGASARSTCRALHSAPNPCTLPCLDGVGRGGGGEGLEDRQLPELRDGWGGLRCEWGCAPTLLPSASARRLSRGPQEAFHSRGRPGKKLQQLAPLPRSRPGRFRPPSGLLRPQHRSGAPGTWGRVAKRTLSPPTGEKLRHADPSPAPLGRIKRPGPQRPPRSAPTPPAAHGPGLGSARPTALT